MIRLEVVGVPAPKGSMRPILRGGHATMAPGSSEAGKRKQGAWVESIVGAVERVRATLGAPLDGAVAIGAVYRLAPLAAHHDEYGPKPVAPFLAPKGRDLDKITRLTFDAITAAGGVWMDDSRVALEFAARTYAPPGAWLGAVIYIAPALDRDGDEVLDAFKAVRDDCRRALDEAVRLAVDARALGRAAKRRSPKRLSRAQAANVLALPDPSFDRDLGRGDLEDQFERVTAGVALRPPPAQSEIFDEIIAADPILQYAIKEKIRSIVTVPGVEDFG